MRSSQLRVEVLNKRRAIVAHRSHSLQQKLYYRIDPLVRSAEVNDVPADAAIG